MMDQELCILVSCDTKAHQRRSLWSHIRYWKGSDLSYLTVKTRCWLIEEEEKFRLSSEFHADSEKLPLLNV